MHPASRSTLLAAIFFASGFSGLIYESIWSHYLKLFLGHAAFAQTLVLAIFMGGMAIGAGLAGRLLHRIRAPLRLYAFTEGGIGLLALAFHPLFVGATEGFYGVVASGAWSPTAVLAGKWILATALILPASVLLGATFPLFAAGQARLAPGREGHTIATLYFANSLGGALGVLASGFWAVPLLGLPGTVAGAGLLNLILAGAVLSLAPLAPEATAARPHSPAPVRDATTRLLLLVAFFTGASSFIYEVGWIRMLSLVLGSATHAFELMLSAFILGLALGGAWIRRRIDASTNPGLLLGRIQVIMGLCAVATLPLYGWTFDFVGWLVTTLPKSDWGYFFLNVGRYMVSAVVMLPAAFCAGMTLPLATRLLFAHRDDGDRAIGRIYSANTLGAIAGVTFAIHFGLPWLGLKFLVGLGAVIDVALGVWLLARFGGGSATRAGWAGMAACSVGILGAAATFDAQKLTSGVFRTGIARSQNTVIETADGKTASIAVEREPEGAIRISTNGKPDATAIVSGGREYKMDEVTMSLIPAIPLAIHPKPARVANIGFGSGMTGEVLLSDPRVTTLDTIEIEPRMVALARHFDPMNRAVYTDPRSRIHIDDAKSFFATRGATYDLIVSEPSNPWVSGVSGLFSREFYRHVSRYLNDDGLFVQWLQVYETHPERVVSVLKAIDETFDDYLLVAMNYGDLLLVARRQGRIVFPDDALARLAPDTRTRLGRLEVRTAGDFALRVVGNKALFAPWLAQQHPPANSDYAPYLDAHADRDRFFGEAWPGGVFIRELSPYLLSELFGARPSWPSPAGVTLTSHFGPQPVTLAPQAAWAEVRGEPPVPPGTDSAWIAPDTRTAAARLVPDCRQPPQGDTAYAALRLGAFVLPYLSPAEGQDFLARTATLPCRQAGAPSSSPAAHLELLLQQLAARDPGFGNTAEGLLDAGEGRTLARARYLLGLGLAGHLARGQRERAQELLARYRDSLLTGSPGLALEILAAHAARGPSGAR